MVNLSGPAGSVILDDLVVEVWQKEYGGAWSGSPGVTVRFAVQSACDAKVNGKDVDWVVTDGDGEAACEITVGSDTCGITAEVMPLMAPPAPGCAPAGSALEFTINVTQ